MKSMKNKIAFAILVFFLFLFSCQNDFEAPETYDHVTVPTVPTTKEPVLPRAEPVFLHIFYDSELNAEDLVAEVWGETPVTCTFASPPDYENYGWQDVTVVLTDEGGNASEVSSRLYIFDKSLTDEFVFEVGVPQDGLTLFEFVNTHLGTDGLVAIEGGDLPFSPDGDIYFPIIASYGIKLTLGDFSTSSIVSARDTIPPAAKPSQDYQYIFPGSSLDPKDLVADIADATQVTCNFETPHSKLHTPHSGWQDVEVRLVDEGGNSTVIKSRYYIFEVLEEIAIEAGTRNGVSVGDFVKNQIETVAVSLEGSGQINYSLPGRYPVKLKSGKYEFLAAVLVRDTTPPTADARHIWTYLNKPLQAMSFVQNIKDVSPVTVRYKTRPDFSSAGQRTIYIIIEDAYGNSAEITAWLTVIDDVTPPVISGDIHKRVAEGGTVSYKSGVNVTDDYDKNPKLSFDSSRVNLNLPGVYIVIYSAVDECGNRAELEGSVTVFAIDMELVNAMADDILAKITNEGMGKLDKARAIYNWVNGKMKYSATNTKRDIARRAYDCFTRGSGDCYTYMAASHVLLTRAGIDNRIVQRIPEASSAHYWNLVNVGTGWHHFDVCPTTTNAVGYNQRFMFTESQAREYTRIMPGRDHYYDYDKSTVPEVVE